MRRFLPVAVVMISLILGATVFRSELASAAMQALDVFVTNDSSHPVPVHEQGTANVNVTGGTVNLGSTPIATRWAGGVLGAGGPFVGQPQCVSSMLASNVVLTALTGAAAFTFFSGGTCDGLGIYTPGETVLFVEVAPDTTTSIPLYDRLPVEGVRIQCSEACTARFAIVGR